MTKRIEIANTGNIFYLVHFDSFVDSRRFFFEMNASKTLEKTKEIAFVEAIKEYVRLSTERGILVNIRSVAEECPQSLKEKLGLDEGYFPVGKVGKKIFGFFDDFYRDDKAEGTFDTTMQEFVNVYEEQTGRDFSTVRHIFAGCESHDCVPSAIQALYRGEGYSAPMIGEQIRILYNGKNVPIGNFVGASDCLWPGTSRIKLNSDYSSERRENALVICKSLEELLRQ